MSIPQKTPENLRAMTAKAVLTVILSASFLAAVVFGPAFAVAQAPKKSKTGPPGMGHAPPSIVAPPSLQSSMPGYGHAGASARNRGKKAPTDRTKPTEPIDPEKLPPGFEVPPEPPEAMTTTEEWIEDPFTERKVKQGTLLAQYNNIIASGEFTGDVQRKLVADIVRWKLSLLTRKEFREQAQFNRNKLLADLKKSPTNPKVGSREVRRFMLKTIAEEAPRLFKYHMVARINGAILLAELSDPDYNEADGDGNRKPAEPCIRALEPLLELVEDKKQFTAPRVWGVNGLVRLGELPELKPQLKNRIVRTLVQELHESQDEHEWYQWRLVEGLGRLNSPIDLESKRPIVPSELGRVLADSKRPWLVRSEAALSLGRLPYPADIDAGLIAYEVALLAQQMAEAYGREPDLDIWKLCFVKVYGAFKPLDAEQKRGLLTQTEKGPLSGYRRTVQEAFEVVLAVIRKVVVDSEGMETAQANLRKWLDSNTPRNFKLAPEEEPIVQDEPLVKKKPATTVSPVPLDDLPATTGASR